MFVELQAIDDRRWCRRAHVGSVRAQVPDCVGMRAGVARIGRDVDIGIAACLAGALRDQEFT